MGYRVTRLRLNQVGAGHGVARLHQAGLRVIACGPHDEHNNQPIDSLGLDREPVLPDPADVEGGMRDAARSVA